MGVAERNSPPTTLFRVGEILKFTQKNECHQPRQQQPGQSASEIGSRSEGGTNLSVLRLLRLFRLVRIARVGRPEGVSPFLGGLLRPGRRSCLVFLLRRHAHFLEGALVWRKGQSRSRKWRGRAGFYSRSIGIPKCGLRDCPTRKPAGPQPSPLVFLAIGSAYPLVTYQGLTPDSCGYT